MEKITGFCKYCTQAVLITEAELTEKYEAADGDPEVASVLAASEKCNCEGAKRERRKAEKLKVAEEWIRNTFSHSLTLERLMNVAVESVINDAADKVSVKCGKWSYSVGLDKEDCIRIRSTHTERDEVSI